MSEPAKDDAPVKIGDVLAGKYRVEEVLGIGGMGAVVAARHLELDELRALKFMLPKVSADQAATKRFLREARAVARLRSEHVATIHDVGRLEGGEPYLVMEYLQGEDLQALLKRRKRLPIEEAAGLALQVVAGLAEAHSVGIVHRDLKPPNVFVCQGSDGLPRAKLLDFGVSKLLGPRDVPDLDVTKTNAMFGSPHYMSPEQMECTRDVDARTDIWSLGVLLYEMLTGEVPFDGPSITALTVLVVNREPKPPRALRPEIPPGLEAIVLRCLEKDPEARYPTVAELAPALATFAPEHNRALAEHVQRVVAAGRPRAPLSSELDPQESADGDASPASAMPGRDARPSGETSPGEGRTREERSKTAATWSGAPPRLHPEAVRWRRVAIGVGAVAIVAVGALVIARPWRGVEPAPERPASAASTEATAEAPAPATAAKEAPRPLPARPRLAGPRDARPPAGKPSAAASAGAKSPKPLASASAAPAPGDAPYDPSHARTKGPYD